MQDFFIRQNIDRYRKMLETASDENERERIVKLLAREEGRLSQFTHPFEQETRYPLSKSGKS